MLHTREKNRVGKLIKPSLITCDRTRVVLDSLKHSLVKAGVAKDYVVHHLEVLCKLNDQNQALQKCFIKDRDYKRAKRALKPKNIYLLHDEVSNFLFSTRLVALESNSHTPFSSHRTHYLRITLEIIVLVPSNKKRECCVLLKMKSKKWKSTRGEN